jgi:hypothetical protein
MTCPHGGEIVSVTANTRAQADGGFILLDSDDFTITGCSFAPSGPAPCITVLWFVDAAQNLAGSNALTDSSEGQCIGPFGIQGFVSIDSTQAKGNGL